MFRNDLDNNTRLFMDQWLILFWLFTRWLRWFLLFLILGVTEEPIFDILLNWCLLLLQSFGEKTYIDH